jgi:predicted HTH transcriptional regulator
MLGVDDNKAIIGISYDDLDAVEKWLAELCQNKIDPPLDIMTQHIELPDSAGQLQPVIIVQVLRSLMVHKSPNGYFKRVAHAKREMKPEVLARLFQQRSQSRLMRFEELAVPNTQLADADALLMRNFLKTNEGDPALQMRRLHLR